ncbi:MAG: GNAT family N-acetyltransferase [Bryobacterales bacterium]|nr:GNAT family N-acetyltransferase [Bryobacterales bacterium]
MLTATQQQPPEIERLLSLLEKWPTDLYSAHGGQLTAESVRESRLRQARSVMERHGSCASLLFEEESLVGAAAWSPLVWDSGHFGFSAARLDLLLADGAYRQSVRRKQHLLDVVLRECEQQEIVHLSVRTQAADLTSIHALEHRGFELIDGIQTFTLCLDQPPSVVANVPEGTCIGRYEPWQLGGILEIAKSAYRFDRFHSDAALPPGSADRLHEDWVRNSCAGQAADLVMVACKQDQVLGFVTVKFDSSVRCRDGGRLATIVLVATAESGRGQGIAKATTSAVLSWLREKNTAAVQVGTQLSNVAAGRLYESCGFRLGATTLTFRKIVRECHQNEY